MENSKITKIEAIFLILIVMVNRIILNLPFSIIEVTKTGSPVNLIYIGVIGLIIVILLNKLFEKFPSSDILDVSEYLGGRFFKLIIAFFAISFLFLSLYITLAEFSNLLEIIYFKRSPKVFILMFFIIASLVANLIGFRSIIKTICAIVPFTILSILITFFGATDEFKIYNFTPILGNGAFEIFGIGLQNLFSFSLINFFIFFKPLLKDSYEFSKVTIFSYLIAWFLLFITVISLMSAFPMTQDTNAINYLYLLSKKITLGNFIQRIDALFIFLWIILIFCYLSIVMFMMNVISKKITNAENKQMFTFFTAPFLLGICLLPTNTAILKFLDNVVYKYSIIILTIILSLTILALANLKFKIIARRKNETIKK